MAIDGIRIEAGGELRLFSTIRVSSFSLDSVCVDEDTSSVLKSGDTGVAGSSVVGMVILGVGGGLNGCSSVWTPLDVIADNIGLALLDGFGDSSNSDVRFLRWFA